MKLQLKFIIGALLLSVGLQIQARHQTPYSNSRIYWDISSKKTLFHGGTYARIIQLQDGRLLAVAESGGGISVNWSHDNGETWGSQKRIVANEPMLPFAVPDVIQLSNGDIVIGYNPRPSTPWSEDRRFGIRCVRSVDGGETWSDQIIIYNASWQGGEGCWEPCFLELPSGELQCYFANENNFPYSGEQEISLCRSFDGGKTWSGETRVCFSGGSRDGMPVPIFTENDEIVVIIEDNGWGGYGGFRATTVRTSLQANWSDWVGRDGKRQMIFANAEDKNYISAAPYLRKLGKDETIASFQGDKGARLGMGEAHFDMFVGVGDADGRNVRAISAPFGLPVSDHGLWNSVTALDDGTVFAVSSIGSGSGEVIYVMKGRAMKGFEAAFGTPEINGTATNETWTAPGARQIFMGADASRIPAHMDFLYDEDNLYFYANVEDRNLFTEGEHDGVTLALDMENASDGYPQKGMYRIWLDVDGTVKFYTGGSNTWKQTDMPEGIKYVFNGKRSNYSMEIAVPWTALGYEKAPVENLMRCYLEITDRQGEDKVVTEGIVEANITSSSTWPEFRLLPHEDTGVGNVGCAERSMENEVEYYNLQGMRLVAPVPGQIVIRREGDKAVKTLCR